MTLKTRFAITVCVALGVLYWAIQLRDGLLNVAEKIGGR